MLHELINMNGVISRPVIDVMIIIVFSESYMCEASEQKTLLCSTFSDTLRIRSNYHFRVIVHVVPSPRMPRRNDNSF